MAKQITLISVFVILNMAIGRMFQESLQVVCFSELSIIAITGFFFWHFSARQIKKWSSKWSVNTKGKNLFIHGGLGLSAALLNILIGQALVIFLMTAVYNCTSPSADFLSASMTNNIGLNLLCYFALLFYFVEKNKENETTAPVNFHNKSHIKVTKKDAQFLLKPKEIIFVETSNNCIVIHTEKGRFVKYQTLKSFSETICPNIFKRVHRSYLVNTMFIDHFEKNHSGDGTLYLKTGNDIRFSRTYIKSFPEI